MRHYFPVLRVPAREASRVDASTFEKIRACPLVIKSLVAAAGGVGNYTRATRVDTRGGLQVEEERDSMRARLEYDVIRV